ncbi:MAG: hypothetical protein F4213_21135 [Boseongicola sp. SB0677_bin_26]|nr:hypothetical protein [Boseongicola sp. SB0665_bin_10]MYG28488.1 hypothetical protein [Boseongicola sp. SB0677_bin_26]
MKTMIAALAVSALSVFGFAPNSSFANEHEHLGQCIEPEGEPFTVRKPTEEEFEDVDMYEELEFVCLCFPPLPAPPGFPEPRQWPCYWQPAVAQGS